jgi:hypothetical protein
MREATEEAFWNFVDQKWRDALNVAAAEPPARGPEVGGELLFRMAGRRRPPSPPRRARRRFM